MNLNWRSQQVSESSNRMHNLSINGLYIFFTQKIEYIAYFVIFLKQAQFRKDWLISFTYQTYMATHTHVIVEGELWLIKHVLRIWSFAGKCKQRQLIKANICLPMDFCRIWEIVLWWVITKDHTYPIFKLKTTPIPS